LQRRLDLRSQDFQRPRRVEDEHLPVRRRRLQRPEPRHAYRAGRVLQGCQPDPVREGADSLPILGKDGTLATSVPNSPAAGKAEIKTGNRAVGTPAGQLILLGNTLAGYIQAKSGRELTCFIGVVNVPLATTADFLAVTADQAQMVVAIQQAF
jgi:D-alanyl-D-alanine carboxypeptidase